MIYLLDTNILIYLIKNQPPAIGQRIDALPPEDSMRWPKTPPWSPTTPASSAE